MAFEALLAELDTLTEEEGQPPGIYRLISLSLSVMTSIAQLIKTSAYVCTGRNPVQASVVFLNELIISIAVLWRVCPCVLLFFV